MPQLLFVYWDVFDHTSDSLGNMDWKLWTLFPVLWIDYSVITLLLFDLMKKFEICLHSNIVHLSSIL